MTDLDHIGKQKILNNNSTSRYQRQVLIPQIGQEGQQKLSEARVLVAGAGGLGGPAAMYLAAAGIGKLGIADADRVDITNLNRQVLYGEADTGNPKSAVAVERLSALNSEIGIERHEGRVTGKNAFDICGGYNIIVDGTDNRETRRILNRVSVELQIPYVYASIYGFEGQVSVFAGENNPCYECIFPEESLSESVDDGPIPVLGAVPGVIGSIQAAETIKIITGAGDTLAGRLLTVDLLTMQFHEIELVKDETCNVCSNDKQV